MQPIRFKPIIKQIRWGGTRLGTRLGKPIGLLTDAAESWEVVDHGDDQSVVSDGPEQGKTLRELVREKPTELLGRDDLKQFPLLIKFLDATDRLSLQVHPDDDQARTFDPQENGKTEAWVILESTPESRIWLGLKKGVTRKELEIAIEEGRFEETVHVVTPHPGDCFFVPAGTVHAIGEGVLLAEIQQSSDLTFRLYDWGRVGADGNPRPLHIEESFRCIDFQRGPLKAVRPRVLADEFGDGELLVDSETFRIVRYRSAEQHSIDPEGRFQIVMMLDGKMNWSAGGESQTLATGETLLIPASSSQVELAPQGDATWLKIDQPPE